MSDGGGAAEPDGGAVESRRREGREGVHAEGVVVLFGRIVVVVHYFLGRVGWRGGHGQPACPWRRLFDHAAAVRAVYAPACGGYVDSVRASVRRMLPLSWAVRSGVEGVGAGGGVLDCALSRPR